MSHMPHLEPHKLEPGQWRWFAGVLYVCLPNGDLANLANHTITGPPEAPTAHPSILTRGGGKEWHGYLTDGQLKPV